MAESAGRRIKRSILISTPTIRFLESGELKNCIKLNEFQTISQNELLKSIMTIKRQKAISRLRSMVEI